MPPVSDRRAEWAMVTQSFTPSNDSAFPNFPVAIRVAPEIVPVWAFPDESVAFVPLASSNPNAATSPGFRSITVHVNERLADSDPSLTVTVTGLAPPVPFAGVPVMRPVDAFSVSPAGRPVEEYVNGSRSRSAATSCRLITSLVSLLWLATAASVGAVLTVAVMANVTETVEAPSLARAVIVWTPTGTVPLIRPVVLLIASPVGSPVAEYVSVSKSGSVATICNVNAPCLMLMLPGLVTDGGRFVATPLT